MDVLIIMNWVLSLACVAASLLNVFKRVESYYIWFAANIMFVPVTILQHQPYATVMWSVYVVTSFWGMLEWNLKLKKWLLRQWNILICGLIGRRPKHAKKVKSKNHTSINK